MQYVSAKAGNKIWERIAGAGSATAVTQSTACFCIISRSSQEWAVCVCPVEHKLNMRQKIFNLHANRVYPKHVLTYILE